MMLDLAEGILKEFASHTPSLGKLPFGFGLIHRNGHKTSPQARKAYAAKIKRQGKCSRCGLPSEGKARCPLCTKTHTEAQRGHDSPHNIRRRQKYAELKTKSCTK